METTADEIFTVVPEAQMPSNAPAYFLEVEGEPHWLIREGEASLELINELNRLATHLIRHGLWEQHRERGRRPPHMRCAS